ncbi:unnamed protein product [Paramecium sonneborni]|uniref:Uncharacterized protein n=1 Tax=Paramecium sonneborni TaxID=65129 RepID=A0A8S1QB86_9CILI|nr:unnamed protein product [Paramecium sonneborni]
MNIQNNVQKFQKACYIKCYNSLSSKSEDIQKNGEVKQLIQRVKFQKHLELRQLCQQMKQK